MKEDEKEEENDWEASMDVRQWLLALQRRYLAMKLPFDELGRDIRRAIKCAEKEAS